MIKITEIEMIIEELEAERDFLISEIAHVYEHDELINKSGRLHVVNKMISRLKEIM